jgi:hypothetical protein
MIRRFMEKKQQRIIIAEACGWTQPEEGYWKDPDGHEWQVMHGWQTYKDGSDILPDLNDLNSCTALIDFLERQGWSCIIIAENRKRCCTFWRSGVEFKVIKDNLPDAICEAFLRTLNLWKDD